MENSDITQLEAGMSRQKKVNWSLNSQLSPKLPIDTAFCQQLVNTSVLSHLVFNLIYHLFSARCNLVNISSSFTFISSPMWGLGAVCNEDERRGVSSDVSLVFAFKLSYWCTLMSTVLLPGFLRCFLGFCLNSVTDVYYCQQSSSPFSNDTFQGDFLQVAYFCWRFLINTFPKLNMAYI